MHHLFRVGAGKRQEVVDQDTMNRYIGWSEVLWMDVERISEAIMSEVLGIYGLLKSMRL